MQNITSKKRLPRHTKNLCIVEIDKQKYVKSYDTLVAKIVDNDLIVQGWWSVTTSKHITYAARHLNLNLINLYKK